MKKKDLPKTASEKKIPHSVQQPTEQEATFQYADILGLGLMILLGIPIYSNSFDCSFQFDDFRTIVEHKNLQNLSNVKGWFNLDDRRIVAVSTFVLNYHFNQFDIKYLASTYGMLEKWDEAIVNFSISIGLDSKNAQFYLNRGLAYCHDKQ
jgi:hypothetical protein